MVGGAAVGGMPGHRLPRPDAGEGDVYFGLIVFPLLSHTHERDARRERARGGIGAAHIVRVASVCREQHLCRIFCYSTNDARRERRLTRA